jgi:hypothetical protein
MSSPGFSIKNRIQFFEAQAELNKDAPKPVGKAVGPCVKPPEPEKPKKPPVTVKIQEKPSLVIVRARPGSSANTGTLHAIEASPPGGEYLWTVKGSAPVDVPGDKTSSSLTVTEKAVGGVAVEVRYTYDGDSATDTTQVEVRAPLIQVTPAKLEFAKLQVGKTSEVKPFTVQNTGQATLRIDEISLSPDTGNFEIVNGEAVSRTIEPSDPPVTIRVIFKPQEGGSKNCGLVILSNALNKPDLNLPVSGVGLGNPKIEVDWRDHDYGKQSIVDQFQHRDLTISNSGTDDLVLSSITLPGTDFKIANPGEYLTTVPPGKSTLVKLKFDPKKPGNVTGKLTIASNATNEKDPIDIALQGTLAKMVTFEFLNDKDSKEIGKIKLKIQQQGQPANEYETDEKGRVQIETLFPDPFDILEASHGDAAYEFVSSSKA